MSLLRASKLSTNAIVAGRYRIVAEVGQGGMSVVYRAADSLAGCDVALKVMRLSSEDPRNELYLQQEFRSMSRLAHPKLVKVYDYGFVEEGVPYFTMELLPGEDLSGVGRLPLEAVFHVLISLADVLAFMHARGYVHRDVKPSNVRLLPTAAGQPLDLRLMDCGLAEEQGKMGDSVTGTLSYLAPEAWLGAPTDARGDLYALGVLAYEISAGQLPFDASTAVRLFRSKTEHPKDLRDARSDVPPAFARLVRDLLAPEPANRPASAMEVLARLANMADVGISPDPLTYLRTPSFVGRSDELAEVRRALGDAERGSPVCLTVVGPAGAGKTRLFDEALLEAGLRGALVARATGRGFAGGAYGVYRELLGILLPLPATREKLVELGGEAALLPHGNLVGLDAAGRELDPVDARRVLHRRFVRLLEGTARHRLVVLAIDDLHLADVASLDALTSLLCDATGGNIAVIATLRSGERQSASLDRFLSRSRHLELGRMTQEQLGELITGAFGPTQPSLGLLSDLARVAEGNVYFVLEILRDLAARGLIEKRRTFVQLPDSLLGLDLPLTLGEALKRRVDALSAAALEVGRLCAVVGHEVDYSLARSLVDRSDECFLDAIDELRRFEVLELAEQRLRLHHARIRDAILSNVEPLELRRLHLRIAEAMERLGTKPQRDCAAALGHHYAEGGAPERALAYLVSAGDARYESYAYADAGTAYRRAYELLGAAKASERDALECKLNDRLGRICLSHDYGNGPLYLERARKKHLGYGALRLIEPFGKVVGPAVAVVLALGLTVLRDVLLGRRKVVRTVMGHLLDCFAATTYLANCHTYSGRINRALAAAEKLRPLVYSKRRLPQAGYQLARGPALGMAGRFDEVLAGCEEALRILDEDTQTPLRTHDRVLAIGGALITLAWVELTRGHVHGSPYLTRFEAFAAEHPTSLLQSWLLEVRVFESYRRGQPSDARRYWEQLVHESAQAEVKFVENKARVWLGMAYLDAGLTGEAQDVADDVIAIAREQDNPMLLALGLELRGLAHRAWEQLDDAAKCYEEAISLLTHPDVGATDVYHSVRLCQASLALDQRQPALARELALEVAAGIEPLALTHDLHRLRVARILGRVKVVEGRPEEGLTELEFALSIATKLCDQLEEAYCWFTLSQAEAALGASRATDSRQRCEALLLALGNEYQLRRLGLRGVEEPLTSRREEVLRRVRKLVGENQQSDAGTGQRPSAERCEPKQSVNYYDQTLPAAESADVDFQAPRGAIAADEA